MYLLLALFHRLFLLHIHHRYHHNTCIVNIDSLYIDSLYSVPTQFKRKDVVVVS